MRITNALVGIVIVVWFCQIGYYIGEHLQIIPASLLFSVFFVTAVYVAKKGEKDATSITVYSAAVWAVLCFAVSLLVYFFQTEPTFIGGLVRDYIIK